VYYAADILGSVLVLSSVFTAILGIDIGGAVHADNFSFS
jgi:hypothetical protein